MAVLQLAELAEQVAAVAAEQKVLLLVALVALELYWSIGRRWNEKFCCYR
jgi:hypothetical protein